MAKPAHPVRSYMDWHLNWGLEPVSTLESSVSSNISFTTATWGHFRNHNAYRFTVYTGTGSYSIHHPVDYHLNFFQLRDVTKKQTRKPIIRGWAINGKNKRITVERIKPGKCPKCRGKMKYYNKPIQRSRSVDINGKVKRRVIKRAPALECLRNSNHSYLVDPAEALD